MGTRGVRWESLQVPLPGLAPGTPSGHWEVPPSFASRWQVEVAAEVDGRVPAAGEAPGGLGRWGSNRVLGAAVISCQPESSG